MDGVAEWLSWASLAFRIPTLHAGDHESEGAKPGEAAASNTYILTLIPSTLCLNMTCLTVGVIDKINGRLTGVNHETVGKLRGLDTGSAKLSGDNNFAALDTGLHNETKDGPTNDHYLAYHAQSKYKCGKIDKDGSRGDMKGCIE